MECILDYFRELTDIQKTQFTALFDLYSDWNSKINVISRKDIEHLYEHHVLHSLGIAKVLKFKSQTQVVDVGTGGGFPAIPLAILFPTVQFHLVDSVGKKIKVAQEVASAIELKNCTFAHSRIEDVSEKFDFVVSRAVMTLSELVRLSRKNVKKEQRNALPNGILCLKGGELDSELKPFKNRAEVYALSDFFAGDFFTTKKVIYLPI